MRVLAAPFAYTEGEKIRRPIARHPDDRKYDLLVFDDGSTDGALDDVDRSRVIVLRNETNQGIGSAMKRVFQYSLDQGYDVLVIQAGNDKDDPLQIPSLLAPIESGAADFVQGSRYLDGGGFGNMPEYPVLGTPAVPPLVFSISPRQR